LSKALGRSRKTYRSGNGKVFKAQKTDKTVIKLNKTKPDGTWAEHTRSITQHGETRQRSVFGGPDYTTVHPHNEPFKAYKPNATLFELSYSKIPGNQLKKSLKL
jgi:hypothetical protein